MKKLLNYLITFIIFFLILIPVSKAQNTTERITNFKTDYMINSDSSVYVTEEIEIYTNQNYFKHGINRDFFTNKMNKNYFPQAYEVIETKIDGFKTYFDTETPGGKFRIKIGDPQVFLTNGIHKIEIKYKIENINAYFANHDEIFINLIGEWDVPIENFSGTIKLADSLNSPEIKIKGYQGIFGSKEDFSNYNKTDNLIKFKSDKRLNPNENISLAVWFPKGTFPNKYDDIKKKENFYTLIILTMVMLAPLITIFFSLKMIGIDSKIRNPTVIYDIPKEITPSIFRYLDKRKVDDKSVTSELIYLAINKFIKFSQNQETKNIEFDFINKDTSILVNQSFYQTILLTLFPIGNQNKFALNKDTNNMTKVSSLVTSIRDNIRSENLEDITDTRNFFEIFFTFIFFISLCGLIIYLSAINSFQILPIYFVFIFIIIVCRLFNKVIAYKISEGFWSGVPSLIFIGLIMTLFLFIFKEDIELIPRIIFMVSYLLFFLNDYLTLYSNRFNQKGLEYLAIIKGFKKFALSQSNYIKGFDQEIPLSLNMYESYLPYAIALDIETEWSKKFNNILSQITDQNFRDENFALYSYSLIGSSVTSSIDSNDYYTSFSSNSFGSGSSSGGFSSDSSSGGGGGSAGGSGW